MSGESICSFYGPENITQEEFAQHFIPLIEGVLKSNPFFILSDSNSLDKFAQDFLTGKTTRVTIYHCGDVCQYNAGNFPTDIGYDSEQEVRASLSFLSTKDLTWARPGEDPARLKKVLDRRKSREKISKATRKALNDLE